MDRRQLPQGTIIETKIITLKIGEQFDPSQWLWGKIVRVERGKVHIQRAAIEPPSRFPPKPD